MPFDLENLVKLRALKTYFLDCLSRKLPPCLLLQIFDHVVEVGVSLPVALGSLRDLVQYDLTLV